MKHPIRNAIATAAIAAATIAYTTTPTSADTNPWCTAIAGTSGRVFTAKAVVTDVYATEFELSGLASGRFDNVRLHTLNEDGTGPSYVFVDASAPGSHPIVRQRRKDLGSSVWVEDAAGPTSAGYGSSVGVGRLEVCSN